MNHRLVLHGIERSMLALGLVMAGFWIDAYSEAQSFQSLASRRLEAKRASVARNTPLSAASRGRKHDATPLTPDHMAQIEIPRLRISAMIAEGTSDAVLGRAVGHVVSSPHPGEPGNVALAAHRESYFRGLGAIHKNDVIRIRTADATYLYKVEWAAIVEPGRLDVLNATAEPSLTLVTCFPFQWVGPAPMRFVVRAVSVSSPV